MIIRSISYKPSTISFPHVLFNSHYNQVILVLLLFPLSFSGLERQLLNDKLEFSSRPYGFIVNDLTTILYCLIVPNWGINTDIVREKLIYKSCIQQEIKLSRFNLFKRQPSRKWANDMNRQFTQKKPWMVNELEKMLKLWLFIKKMPSKSTVR